jgi:hypothetical protein
MRSEEKNENVCPECGKRFKGKGFEGIDAHWRAKKFGHENIMPYEDAWPLIRDGRYTKLKKKPPGKQAKSI